MNAIKIWFIEKFIHVQLLKIKNKCNDWKTDDFGIHGWGNNDRVFLCVTYQFIIYYDLPFDLNIGEIG